MGSAEEREGAHRQEEGGAHKYSWGRSPVT